MRTKPTHKQSILQAMKRTKDEMCKILGFFEDTYDVMRYELAIAWLQYQEFYEATARVLILSESFFKWWYQQLNACERIFIDYELNKYKHMQRKDAFFEFVISMEIRPSRVVYSNIRKEGFAAIEKNPELKKLKIYEDDKTTTKTGIKDRNRAA